MSKKINQINELLKRMKGNHCIFEKIHLLYSAKSRQAVKDKANF